MIRRLVIFCACLATPAFAQITYRVTNNWQSLDPSAAPLVGSNDQELQILSTTINNLGEPYNLGTQTIRAVIVSPLGFTNSTASAGIWSAEAGEVMIRWRPTNVIANQRLKVTAVDGTNAFPIGDHYISVTNAYASGGSGSVNISSGAVQVAVNQITTGVASVVTSGDGVTTTPTRVRFAPGSSSSPTSSVSGAETTVHMGGSSGGGNITINGYSTNAWTFSTSYPITLTNSGNVVYWGMSALSGGVFVPSSGATTVVSYISNTTQQYIVSATATYVHAYVWSGAGGGSVGGGQNLAGGPSGVTYAKIPVTSNEALTLTIGKGGDLTGTGDFAVVAGAWPNGGAGVKRVGTERSGAGGGRSQVARGTNILVVCGAGGGGAGGGSSTAPAGGGTTGYGGTTGGTTGTGGGGGSQTNGGTTGSTAIPLVWTNTAGSAFHGGDGGATTNRLDGAAGGGGDGYYGGGGGLAYNTAGNSRAQGGGGSGWINVDAGCQGITIRGEYTVPNATAAYPPLMELPFYVAGCGVGNVAAAGGNGLIVLIEE